MVHINPGLDIPLTTFAFLSYIGTGLPVRTCKALRQPSPIQMTAMDPHNPSTERQGYFAQFSGFEQNENAPLINEFKRLALSMGWTTRSKRYKKEKKKCFAQEFDRTFGADEGKLYGWQRLCLDVGIEPPATITQCKKVLSNVAVNIVDLVDHRRIGTQPTLFKSKAALRKYCIDTGKIFDKKKAKRDGFLSVLLIHVFK